MIQIVKVKNMMKKDMKNYNSRNIGLEIAEELTFN